jgi:hypothetical protein
MEPTYPSGDNWYYVYYKKEKDRWVIVAVLPEGDRRPHPFTPRTVTKAVDELGAFQKVNTWLQKSNAALSKMTPAL